MLTRSCGSAYRATVCVGPTAWTGALGADTSRCAARLPLQYRPGLCMLMRFVWLLSVTPCAVVLLLAVGSHPREPGYILQRGLLESAGGFGSGYSWAGSPPAEFQLVLSDSPNFVVLLGEQMSVVCCRFRGCRERDNQAVPVAEVCPGESCAAPFRWRRVLKF